MTHVDNNTESRKSKHLTYGEMQKIEAYKALDLSNRKIAVNAKLDSAIIAR